MLVTRFGLFRSSGEARRFSALIACLLLAAMLSAAAEAAVMRCEAITGTAGATVSVPVTLDLAAGEQSDKFQLLLQVWPEGGAPALTVALGFQSLLAPAAGMVGPTVSASTVAPSTRVLDVAWRASNSKFDIVNGPDSVVVGNALVTVPSTASPGDRWVVHLVPYDSVTKVGTTAKVATSGPIPTTIGDDVAVSVPLPRHTLTTTVSPAGAGTVTGGGSYEEGEAVQVEAAASYGWAFDHWSGDLSGSDNPASVVMPSDKSVTANFTALPTHTLDLSGIGSGSVIANGTERALPWNGAIVAGDEVTLEASPASGWEFVAWFGGLSGGASPVTFAVDADTAITVKFVEEIGFSDVSEDYWARQAIAACVDAGIVFGYPDGTYLPGNTVTRAQMAVYVARGLCGGDAYVPTGPAEAAFPDVTLDHWAFSYVEYAAGRDIVVGYGDGTYQPSWAVTRAQMAVFIARSIVDPTGDEGLSEYTPPETPTFPDVPVDYWCWTHVEYLAEQGVVAGYEDHTYRPTTIVTRDQMAVYAARAFGLI